MVWYHRYSLDEIVSATGLDPHRITAAMARFDIRPGNRPARAADAPPLVLPYPGGRHPRIGFLDGAIEPRRETKISVFTPWDEDDYAVVDVPEAIWSNLGLTYLAHTHIDTIWTTRGIELPKIEWHRGPGGLLEMRRELPNGIVFGTQVLPWRDAVYLRTWLYNGTDEALTGLRVQMCTMLSRMKGFAEMTDEMVLYRRPFTTCRSATHPDRWIITAWWPNWRSWHNPPVPCIHSDPQLPDCGPGQTVWGYGILTFYEGPDIASRLDLMRRALDLPGAVGTEGPGDGETESGR